MRCRGCLTSTLLSRRKALLRGGILCIALSCAERASDGSSLLMVDWSSILKSQQKAPSEEGLSDSVDLESTDGMSLQSYRSELSSSQVEREVVSIALVHFFHAKARMV